MLQLHVVTLQQPTFPSKHAGQHACRHFKGAHLLFLQALLMCGGCSNACNKLTYIVRVWLSFLQALLMDSGCSNVCNNLPYIVCVSARACRCLYGGASRGPQGRSLSRAPQLIIATPGRLLDFVTSGELSLNRVS